jgi:hypothetical protein
MRQGILGLVRQGTDGASVLRSCAFEGLSPHLLVVLFCLELFVLAWCVYVSPAAYRRKSQSVMVYDFCKTPGLCAPLPVWNVPSGKVMP